MQYTCNLPDVHYANHPLYLHLKDDVIFPEEPVAHVFASGSMQNIPILQPYNLGKYSRATLSASTLKDLKDSTLKSLEPPSLTI